MCQRCGNCCITAPAAINRSEIRLIRKQLKLTMGSFVQRTTSEDLLKSEIGDIPEGAIPDYLKHEFKLDKYELILKRKPLATPRVIAGLQF